LVLPLALAFLLALPIVLLTPVLFRHAVAVTGAFPLMDEVPLFEEVSLADMVCDGIAVGDMVFLSIVKERDLPTGESLRILSAPSP
jgi:hypothetical protein